MLTSRTMVASPIVRLMLLVLALFVVARPVMRVADHVESSQALPQWDMAKYGLAGLELADAARRLDVLGLVTQVSSMSSWPPGFPLLEAPAFFLFGADYRVPRLLVCALFLVTLMAAMWAGQQLDEDDGLAAGILLAGLLAGSPLLQVFAGLVMLEIPGALLFLVALGNYFRALRLDDQASWRWTALFSLALFFTKFNYGLMWFAALALSEVWRRENSWRWFRRVFLTTLSMARRHRAGAGCFVCFLLLLGWIRLAGGIDFVFLGIRLKASSIGNPVYVLYLLSILACLLRPQRCLEFWRRWFAVLDPPLRLFTRWLILPIALWMAIPPHAKDFFGFVENRSSGFGVSSLENLLFYPRVLVFEGCQRPALGGLLLIAGILPCFYLARLEVRGRALALAVICHALAIWLHPYKLPRFALTLVPLLWLLASWLLVKSLRAVLERTPARRITSSAMVACALCAAGAIGSHFHELEVQRQWSLRTVAPTVAPLLDRIVALAAGEEGTLVLGTWNQLSPALVEWHFRRHEADRPQNAPRTVRPSSKERRRVASDLPKISQVVLIEPLPGMVPELASEARRENAWLVPLRGRLEGGETHVLVADEELVASGYRLRVFGRGGVVGVHSPSRSGGGGSRIPFSSSCSRARS